MAFSRTLSEMLGALTSGALIYSLGGLLGLMVTLRTPDELGQILRMPKRYLLGCGTLFVTYVLLLYLAIGLACSRAQVLAIGLANYLWPSLIMLFSLLLLGKRARIWLVPGILLALTGTWIAFLQNDSSALFSLFSSGDGLLPIGLAVSAAVIWALYSNLVRRWAPVKGSAVPLFLLTSGLTFLALRWLTGEISHWNWALLPTLLYMAVFPTWLGYLCWDVAMQRGDMYLVTAFSYFTPLFSTLISLLVLHIQFSWQLGLAAVLVTGGAVLSKLGVVESDEKGKIPIG